MKHGKVFSTLALAIVLSLLALAIPATPALAADGTISINPTSGPVGTAVSITGSGFTGSSSYTVTFSTTAVVYGTCDSAGGFSTSFPIPAYYKGTFPVSVTTSASDTCTTLNFTVTPQITLSATSGYVGGTVTIDGTGFASTSSMTFYLDGISRSTTAIITSTSGSFTGTSLAIPSSTRGSHTIKALDASGNYATATFSVLQKITITPESGAPGTTVTMAGTGFSASKSITIKFSGVIVTTSPASIATDSTGSFTGSFTVPAGLADEYVVEASDGTYSATANFTSIADATISQTTTEASPGHVGMELTITGTGFKPNATVTVSYVTNPVVLATLTTDGNGAFSVVVTIPPSTGGNHTITVTDGHTTKELTFVMESAAPPAPEPLLPADATKAKSEAYFDWEDITDDSGVTYTLQIASDTDFTNILLQKTSLDTSEYQLTEEEKLESVGKDKPYYWRVQAIDGASNTGEWMTPASFYVGFIFSMPGWIIYLLFGLGAICLGVLGFWLGRRTAYY